MESAMYDQGKGMILGVTWGSVCILDIILKMRTRMSEAGSPMARVLPMRKIFSKRTILCNPRMLSPMLRKTENSEVRRDRFVFNELSIPVMPIVAKMARNE